MHASATNIGAYVKTAGASNAVQGYPPSLLTAGTDYGDSVDVTGYKSLVMTPMTGTATGSPTTQSTKVSLQSAPAGTEAGGTWTDVTATEKELTADEKATELDFNLMGLTSGHSLVRCKVVVAFTGGSTPKQSVTALLTLGGHYSLPI